MAESFGVTDRWCIVLIVVERDKTRLLSDKLAIDEIFVID